MAFSPSCPASAVSKRACSSFPTWNVSSVLYAGTVGDVAAETAADPVGETFPACPFCPFISAYSAGSRGSSVSTALFFSDALPICSFSCGRKIRKKAFSSFTSKAPFSRLSVCETMSASASVRAEAELFTEVSPESFFTFFSLQAFSLYGNRCECLGR